MIIDPVAHHARMSPKALAIVDLETDRRWSYQALDRLINQTAHWLIDKLGPASGERVASLGKNCSELVILQLACERAGAIYAPFNWRLARAEVAGLIEDAGPEIGFAAEEFSLPEFAHGTYDLAALSEVVSDASDAPTPKSAWQDIEKPSTLLFTSGTSGRPKGVMLSVSNGYWGCINFIFGSGVSRDSVFLCDLPLFHVSGLYAVARTPLLAGGTLLVSSGFDPAKTLARMMDPDLKITNYFSVPQMAQVLWNRPEFDPSRLQNLRTWALGGAPNPAAQAERFAKAGVPLAEGFGMSETGSNFGIPTDDPALVVRKAGSCGLPFLMVEARIVDENGSDVLEGESGELWVRGPSITKGYWNQPDVTAKAFEGDWFKTGDAAFRDEDGFYFIVDRKKDMYISGGENVYPAEVEAAIAELLHVAEAAIIGVPDERWGEVGRAYITPVAGKSVTEKEIIDHCTARLAKYKVPKSVVVTDDIPHTASGKVQKHILKMRAEKEMAG